MTAGLDNIPSFLLKDVASIFVTPLFYLFNIIIKYSSFPTIWKKASITPDFKKGDPTLKITDLSAYFPTFPKILNPSYTNDFILVLKALFLHFKMALWKRDPL